MSFGKIHKKLVSVAAPGKGDSVAAGDQCEKDTALCSPLGIL